MKQFIIGFKPEGDRHKVTTFQETKEQIQEVMKYQLNLFYREENRQLEWSDLVDLDNYRDLRLFNAILGDRERREKHLMANRPQFAVLTVEGSEIVRLEFYDYNGVDGHELAYDVRKKEYYEKDMKPWMR